MHVKMSFQCSKVELVVTVVALKVTLEKVLDEMKDFYSQSRSIVETTVQFWIFPRNGYISVDLNSK